ncbi:hypothetical protein [Laspinema palackyanum]|uniref:hypothetical protein n=1 Tax=Laspinema palackyanum TaxID=3231601 RepID=UPI00345CF35F|nr:hypothetical protein [Laspinema sp. D2c]
MNYLAYNLQWQSVIPLPEFLPDDNSKPDVLIQYGDVPTALSNPRDEGVSWQANPGKLLLNVKDVARYLVCDGCEIWIEPAAGSVETDVRAFLLGSAVGALLNQRKILVLHASAIQTARGAVLFTGYSGRGKSTLLAAMLQRGYSMLADDKTAIVLDEEGYPLVIPGYPSTRLWAEAVAKLNYSFSDLPRVRPNLDKYIQRVDCFCRQSVPLYAIYVLESHQGQDIQLEAVEDMHRFTSLYQHYYRKEWLRGLNLHLLHFQITTLVAKTTRITRIVRPQHLFLLDELANRVDEDINI